MGQPTKYTEPPGDAEIEIDVPDRSCFTCARQEAFGENRYVVWCTVHLGHVPVTCWCGAWRPGLDAPQNVEADGSQH